MENIKIYVANLGKYNEGELVGEWLSLPATEEEIEQMYVRIKVAHYDEDGEFVPYYEEDGIIYEETAIHDYESDFDNLSIGEWDSIEELNELAEDIEPEDIELLDAIIEVTGCTLKEAIDQKWNVTYYSGMSLEDVAYELVEDCYNLDDFAKRYFDYEAFARDLSFDGYTETKNGVLFI